MVPDPAKRQSTLNTWQRNDYRHEILHLKATWLMHAQFLLYSTCQPGCKYNIINVQRAAHIEEDVPWIYLPANVDVQFSHATICIDSPNQTHPVVLTMTAKRKGSPKSSNVQFQQNALQCSVYKRKQAARKRPAPHGGEKCVARGL